SWRVPASPAPRGPAASHIDRGRSLTPDSAASPLVWPHRPHGRARSSSTPRKRTMRYRMQLSFREARKTKRFKQTALATEDFIGDQLAQGDHLVAVIGVGDHVAILMEYIDDWKAVG